MVGDTYWRLRWDDRLKKAGRYPETVALTKLLVTSQWRSLALFGHRLWPDDTLLMEFA